jgi:hypothetical protein
VEAFRVGDSTPVASITTKSGPVAAPTADNPHSDYNTRLDVDAGSVDETKPYTRGKWFVRLTNNTDRVAEVGYEFRYIRDTSLITEATIPLSVLNNAFALVLKALAPYARVTQSKLRAACCRGPRPGSPAFW